MVHFVTMYWVPAPALLVGEAACVPYHARLVTMEKIAPRYASVYTEHVTIYLGNVPAM